MALTSTPRLGATTLQIRRAFEGASALAKAAILLLFVAQRRPAAATACYCLKKILDSCANSGHTANYLEVGGRHAGLLKSVGNTFANSPGYALPLAGLWCWRRYASYAPLFAGVAGLQVSPTRTSHCASLWEVRVITLTVQAAAGLIFVRCVQIEPVVG